MGDIGEILLFIPQLILTIITLPLRLLGFDIDFGIDLF